MNCLKWPLLKYIQYEKLMKKLIQSLSIAALLTSSSMAFAEDLHSARTIDMCVEYNTAAEDRKNVLYKELERRGMLSYKDLDSLKTGEVYKGSSVCGMYMVAGTPLAEKGKQLRIMTYKVVHVYPKYYYVSQSGIVMDVLERKPGTMPPTLIKEAPEVAPPPVLYNSPAGSHQH